MSKEKIFVKPRLGDGFGAKHEHGKRTFFTAKTQHEVIEAAKGKYPDAALHVASVRNVGPGPDKFRKT